MKDKTSKILLIFAIMYCVLRTVGTIILKIEGTFSLFSAIESVVVAVICFTLYYSYEKHTKNVMKPLLGAVLMLTLYVEIDLTSHFIVYSDKYLNEFSNAVAAKIMIACVITSFVFMMMLNIMHYVINLTHHSSSEKVLANKIFFILFIVSLVGQSVSSLFLGAASALTAIHICCLSFSRILPIWSVIIVENTLDEFRIAREAR